MSMNALKAGMLALVFWLGTAAAQGIPVFDASAVAKAVEQLVAWKKQFNQMQESISYAKSQLQAATGTRNLGAVLDNVGSEATVPIAIVQQWRALTRHEDLVRQSLQATEQALQTTSARGAQIRALMQAVNATTDPKSAAEIQARLQAEVALVSTDVQRIQLMQIEREAQQRRIDEDLRQRTRQDRAKPLATW